MDFCSKPYVNKDDEDYGSRAECVVPDKLSPPPPPLTDRPCYNHHPIIIIAAVQRLYRREIYRTGNTSLNLIRHLCDIHRYMQHRTQ